HIGQADFPIHEVMVIVQTPARFAPQLELFRGAVGTYLIRPATLDHFENADQPLPDAVALGHASRPRFFIHDAVVQVLDGSPLLDGYFLSQSSHLGGAFARE